MEWLILMAVLGLAVGGGAGYLLGMRTGSGARRVQELESELAGARRELEDYRQQVVDEFKETARKFQTLNDSYTDLHQQLARSSSVLCAGVAGPLLAAPAGQHDLISAEARSAGSDAPIAPAAAADPAADEAVAANEPAAEAAAEPEATAAAAEASADPEAAEPPTLRERVGAAYGDASHSDGADREDIRVPEPFADDGTGVAAADEGEADDAQGEAPNRRQGHG